MIICLFCGFFIVFGNTDTLKAQSRSGAKISKIKKKVYGNSTQNRRISRRSTIRSRNRRSSRASRLSYQRSRIGYGTRSRFAPSLSSTIKYNNYNYRYYKGMYYRPYNNSFQVVRAPIGITVNSIPNNRYKFLHGGVDYFYSHGEFYRSIGNKYQVVHAPIGARFSQLPPHAERFEWSSNIYYASDEAFFKEIYDEYGGVAYEIVQM